MGRKGTHGHRDRRRDAEIPVLQGGPRCMHHILVLFDKCYRFLYHTLYGLGQMYYRAKIV